MVELSVDWVALALYMVERIDVADFVALSPLIGAADMVNHSILSVSELCAGLDGLSGCGWLEVEGTVCSLAPEAQRIIAEAMDEAQSPMAWSQLKAKRLHYPPFMESAAPAVDSDVFERGVTEYNHRMGVLLAKAKS